MCTKSVKGNWTGSVGSRTIFFFFKELSSTLGHSMNDSSLPDSFVFNTTHYPLKCLFLKWMIVKLFVSIFREEGQLIIKRNQREISVRPLSQSKIELLKAGVSTICQLHRRRHMFSKSTYVQNTARLLGRRLCSHLHLSRSHNTVASFVKLINNTQNSEGDLCCNAGLCVWAKVKNKIHFSTD